MKKRNIIILSIFACVFHGTLLQTKFNTYVLTSGVKTLLFVGVPLLVFKNDFKKLFAKPNKIKIPLILGFFVFVFILLVFAVIRPYLDKILIVNALNHNGITAGNFPFVFLYIVAINAFLEELFFRGFVFLSLKKTKFAFWFSAFLFAIYHVSILNGSMELGVFLFCVFGLVCAGVIFNKVVKICNSIFASLIVHISANLALNLIMVYYLYSK